MRIFCIKSPFLVVLEAHGQHQVQEIIAIHGQHLDRAQGAADFHAHLFGAGVAQSIQQLAVVEADLHLVALTLRVEFIHHAAQIRLAAHHDFPLCKGNAEGIF